jgi:hypothetical protein
MEFAGVIKAPAPAHLLQQPDIGAVVFKAVADDLFQ